MNGRPARLAGPLQHEVMRTVWRLRAGTVDEIRASLPPANTSAYTTIQTVLNRLADRGLLERELVGRHYRYRPRVSEAEFVAGAIRRALDGASLEARQTALATLLADVPVSSLRRAGLPR